MADSYRPGRASRAPPPLADRMTFTSGGGDNYRPGGQQQQQQQQHSDFTFTSSHQAPRFPPTGPAADAGSRSQPRKRARGGPSGPNTQRDYSAPSRAPSRGHSNGYRGRGRGRGGFRAPHERALLQVRDDVSPEHIMGVEGPNRFLDVDELSEDEEAAAGLVGDKSADDAWSDGQDGSHKVARTQPNRRADGDSVPQWCNPDPYTALPPPEEVTGKKIDFVKMLRKAKNQAAEKAQANNAVAANDDFISFGDDDAADEESMSVMSPAHGIHTYEDDEPALPPPRRNDPAHRPVRGSMNDIDHASMHTRSHDAPQNDVPVGKRAAQTAGLSGLPPRPGRASKRKHTELESSGIVEEWLPDAQCHPAPWVDPRNSYAHLANDPFKWLHNEILDFYDFVAPQAFEHDIRHALVKRIQAALGTQRLPADTGRILSFGSFPAGLYLPTADMDLVYTSDRHFNGGQPVLDFSSKSAVNRTLRGAARRLEQVHIATNVLVISKAKVPIIKFTDRVTNLHVDISFENLSGVQAQATFAQWKSQYPDMIYMVALLKQFLVMRGMNEVHQGGLGGFSIICLIVSYLQHAPKSENLGECFLGFLKYYGQEFNLSRQRIQMYPPAIIEKTSYGIDGRPEKADGLSIQDPNRPENNISGGSHKAREVFKAFGKAYRTLNDHMEVLGAGSVSPGHSILGCILGGNYSSYIMQRRHFKSLT